MMKRLFILLFCVCSLTILLLSCAKVRSYRDDVSINELSEIPNALDNEYQMDRSDVLEDYILLPDYVAEHAVFYKKEPTVLDEIGLFRVTGENAEHLAKLLKEDYLLKSYDKNHTFYDSYMPKETKKLADAEVRTFGNYVVYAILSEGDKALLFEVMEKALTAA